MIVKRGQLIKRIADRAKEAGVDWAVDREGSNHTVYRLGKTMIPVPRHREIDNVLAEKVFKECQPELGQRWWK